MRLLADFYKELATVLSDSQNSVLTKKARWVQFLQKGSEETSNSNFAI